MSGYITAAYGLDTSWHEEGKCLAWKGEQPGFPTPWQYDPNQNREFIDEHGKRVVLRGREMIRAALMVCHSCPAQYDCARYAVKGWAMAGTWAMNIHVLQWLQKQRDWGRLIDYAEANDLPLQDYVQDVSVGIRRRPSMSA